MNCNCKPKKKDQRAAFCASMTTGGGEISARGNAKERKGTQEYQTRENPLQRGFRTAWQCVEPCLEQFGLNLVSKEIDW
jgi:hypothetical protein